MKTSKKIYTRLMILIFSLVAFSCNDNINLDPEGIITADSYFNSPEDYDKALNALYARLNINKYDMWMDGVTDDGLVTHSWNKGYDLGRGNGTTFSSFPSEKWTNGYISVQRANNVISNIDKYNWAGGDKNELRNQILSEARTLRAYFYLDLVCLFGRIMFYEKNPVTVAESKTIPQVEDPSRIFDFVLKELDESIQYLPEKASSKSRLNSPTARLLRARAAAYAAGYLNDKSYFNITLTETEVLLSNAPKLEGYEKLFTYGNTNLDEVMLVRDYNVDQKNDFGEWYNNSIGGYCVTTPVKALVDAYEYIGTQSATMPYTNKDPRFYATIYAPGSEIRGKYYNTIPKNTVEKNGKIYFDPAKDYGSLQDKEVLTGDVLGETGSGEWNKTPTGFSSKKYFTELETWNTYNAYIIFRYAEAYLLRAEALVETGGSTTEAKNLIQTIRDRAGNSNDIEQVITDRYNGNLLNFIRNEKRIEMALEGLRLYDIRRWKLVEQVMNQPAQGIVFREFNNGTPTPAIYNVVPERKFTERDYWWPIPQAELDLNKGTMTQNKGWEE